jgi:hypothetical protein
MSNLAEIGDNFMVYGNVFVTIYFPFDRYLVCPHCGTRYLSSKVPYKFDSKNAAFNMRCPKCEIDIVAGREDIRSDDTSRVKVSCLRKIGRAFRAAVLINWKASSTFAGGQRAFHCKCPYRQSGVHPAKTVECRFGLMCCSLRGLIRLMPHRIKQSQGKHCADPVLFTHSR